MKKIVLSLALSALMIVPFTMNGQEMGPQAGDISVALKFGRAVNFGDVSYSEVNRLPEAWNKMEMQAISQPTSGSFSSTNNFTNIIGAEVKYFVTNEIAVRFSGSGMFSGAPSQDAVAGVADPDANYYGDNQYPGTYVPKLSMLEGRSTRAFYLNLGGDYYFAVDNDRLHPYAGLQFNSIYQQMELFDGFRGIDDDEVIPTYDTRRGEAFAWGTSIVGGVDYYLAPGFFLGVEIKAFSYLYAGKQVFYQTGMDSHSANNHNTAFLAQPSLRLGFRF